MPRPDPISEWPVVWKTLIGQGLDHKSSPDPISEWVGVWKALIGQVCIISPALQLRLGQVLETQGLRIGMLWSCKETGRPLETKVRWPAWHHT